MQHHILLISLDALRADRLTCYGNPRPVSPTIQSLLDESVLFRHATSPATWTLPGHMSMLSGLEPPVHGCVSSLKQYPPKTLPFPLAFELLQKAGLDPAALVGGGFMEAGFGFGRGVKNFQVIHEMGNAIRAAAAHIQSSARTFTFLHTYIVHDYPRLTTQPDPLRFVMKRDPDYRGYFPQDRDFIALLRALAVSGEDPGITARDIAFVDDLYHAGLATADKALFVLLRRLQDLRAWPYTTLILTSDHGESLGDMHDGHRFWFHGGPPHEEQVHVPLLIRPAEHLRSILPPGSVVEPSVSLIDLLPTLLELEEIDYPRDQYDGLSLLDLCQGQVAAFETRRLFFHSCEDPNDLYLASHLFGTGFYGPGRTKVIENHRTGELRAIFDLETDPHEVDNRIARLSEDERRALKRCVDEYRESVGPRWKDPPSQPYEDNALLKRLAALGYIES